MSVYKYKRGPGMVACLGWMLVSHKMTSIELSSFPSPGGITLPVKKRNEMVVFLGNHTVLAHNDL